MSSPGVINAQGQMGERRVGDTASLGCKFLGTACPPEPFEACGPDPTPDGLECGEFPGCP